MASWTQTFSVNNKYSLTLTCTEQSYSVPNNNSVVAYSLTMATAANSFTGYSDYRTTVNISINGSTVYTYNASRDFNYPVKSSYSEVLKSGTVIVPHDDATGEKVCACAASVSVALDDYSPGSASISGSLTLTTIPRASSVSASGQLFDNPVAITINRASTSFTHNLTWTIGSQSGLIRNGVGTSWTWTPSSDSLGQYITPPATSATVTITCTTKNGTKTVGSPTTTSLTLTIPGDVKPECATGWQDPDNVNSGGAAVSPFSPYYIQGYSKLKITIDQNKITYHGGASFQKYRLTVGGKSYDSYTTTVTSNTLTTAGNIPYTISVYDTRNRYYSSTGTVTVYAYSNPSISSTDVFRSDSGGVADSSGAYASVKANANVSSVNSLNSYTLRTRYQESGGSWSGWTTLTSGTASVIGGGMVANKTYIVAVELTDTMGNTATTQATIPTESVTFNLKDGGLGAAFGKYAETDQTLELASDWFLNAGAGVIIASTVDVLADALAMTSSAIRGFWGAGASYTGNLPNSNYAYGAFLVIRRAGNSIFVLAIPNNPSLGLALNRYDGSSWVGWQCKNTAIKSASISVSAGTIGTRGGQRSWSTADIGGTPLYAMVTKYGSSNNCQHELLIDQGTLYLNLYRSTSSAFTETVEVTIYYNPT